MKVRRFRLKNLNEPTTKEFRRHLGNCRCVAPYHNKRASTAVEVVSAAHRFLGYLRRTGVTRPAATSSAVPPVITEFRSWMKAQRGTADATLVNYCRMIGRLLDAIDGDLSRLDARAIRSFTLGSSERGNSCSHSVVTALRSFTRFLIANGRCASDLDRAVPAIAQWRLSSLPRYISYRDVGRLIATCNQTTETGTRDRAILLLLARLALRGCDVRALKLADFDWEHGSVIVSGKTAREARLPLPQEVGNAVLKYLKKRPRTDSTVVFQTTIAPLKPIGPGAMSGVMERAIAKAGIKTPSFGTHLLRHSAATEMLRQGATLEQVRAVLRHSSPETTLLYAKVDFEALKTIAQPWPEVAPC